MTSPTTTPAATYCGWWRESKAAPWRKLVDSAPNWDAAWSALLDSAPPARLGEMLVLRAGQSPGRAAMPQKPR
jgi:hypothetical protein